MMRGFTITLSPCGGGTEGRACWGSARIAHGNRTGAMLSRSLRIGVSSIQMGG